jgi:hypothetical protein
VLVSLHAYIGPPGRSARYQILLSCVRELQRTGIVASAHAPPAWAELHDAGSSELLGRFEAGMSVRGLDSGVTSKCSTPEGAMQDGASGEQPVDCPEPLCTLPSSASAMDVGGKEELAAAATQNGLLLRCVCLLIRRHTVRHRASDSWPACCHSHAEFTLCSVSV